MKKFTFIFLTLSILFLSSCGSEKKRTDGEITVKFWHSFISSSVPALKELITKFEEQNPGIKIDAQ
ncbi:MAG: hypothetical protein MUE91_09635 [Ignavibacteriaceae bacterium]|nr:hypothetical protein [Ignavibacteriaceae bacterium]